MPVESVEPLFQRCRPASRRGHRPRPTHLRPTPARRPARRKRKTPVAERGPRPGVSKVPAWDGPPPTLPSRALRFPAKPRGPWRALPGRGRGPCNARGEIPGRTPIVTAILYASLARRFRFSRDRRPLLRVIVGSASPRNRRPPLRGAAAHSPAPRIHPTAGPSHPPSCERSTQAPSGVPAPAAPRARQNTSSVAEVEGACEAGPTESRPSGARRLPKNRHTGGSAVAGGLRMASASLRTSSVRTVPVASSTPA